MESTLPILVPKVQYQEIPSMVQFAAASPTTPGPATQSTSKMRLIITPASIQYDVIPQTGHKSITSSGVSTEPVEHKIFVGSDPALDTGREVPRPQKLDLLPSLAFRG